MTRPRAFLVERTSLDVSEASKYGSLTYVFGDRSARPSIFTPEFGAVLINELNSANFDPAIDYLVVSGPVASIVVVASEIVAQYGSIKLLVFDARLETYVQVDIGSRCPVEET